MKTVSTKIELKNAIEGKQFPIKCIGEIAEQLKKKKKRSKYAKITGVTLAIAGIVAMPFTGGASAVATVTGLTAGGLVISTAELAILVGGGVAITGILKGRKVNLQSDGSVIIE